MNGLSRPAIALLAGLSVLAHLSPASAGVAGVNWSTTPLYQHKDFNAVDGDGKSTFPLGDSVPLRLQGVILNNPEDMLDQTGVEPVAIPFYMGAQWQVFVQAIDPDDYGGTAVYMAQLYGNRPDRDADQSQTIEEWDAEMARVNYDRTLPTHQFRAGDLVEIHAQAGKFYGGKLNVNEDHFKVDGTDFELALITADYGLPTPIDLELADIWDGDPATGEVLFDPARLAGGEHHQSSLVRLMNVKLVGDGSNWATDNYVDVVDADGRVFPLHLGLRSGFSPAAAPTGYFHVTGIFNQEDTDDFVDYTAGYEVWVMDPNAIELPGDYNGDGSVDATDYTVWRDTLGSSGDLRADGDLSGSVDADDYAVWKMNFGAAWTPAAGSGTVAVEQVPEPQALLLALAAMAVFRAPRRRPLAV